MSERYSSKSDAVSYGIIPALGEFADDFDVDEIFDRYYAWDGSAFVPGWTIEHPDWVEEPDTVGCDLFWEIAKSCDKGGK